MNADNFKCLLCKEIKEWDELQGNTLCYTRDDIDDCDNLLCKDCAVCGKCGVTENDCAMCGLEEKDGVLLCMDCGGYDNEDSDDEDSDDEEEEEQNPYFDEDFIAKHKDKIGERILESCSADDELFNQLVKMKIELIIKGVIKIDEKSFEGQEKLKRINQHIEEYLKNN